MPRPRIALDYQHRVAELAEQTQNVAEITRRIEQEADEQGRGDAPSERTVRRIYSEHRAKNPGDRRQYARFRWPESMQEAGIPWEGSKDVLRLLRRHHEVSGNDQSPPIGFVKWCWRVMLAAPDLKLDRQARVAAFLFAHEQTPDAVPEPKVRSLESFLIEEAWKVWPDWLPPDVLAFGYPRWIGQNERE